MWDHLWRPHPSAARPWRRLSQLALCVALVVSVPAPARAVGVTHATLTGTVGVQMEEFVRETIRAAEGEGRALIVFQLDTPGGLVEAMRGIVQSMLASRVPVAVWVPPGGRAASAGAFIVQAAHVAAMAPGTNIGAAHPVVASGKDIEDGEMGRKVMNDLKAQMRSIVQLRGRDQGTAERMVEESLSLTAHEALEAGAIDVIVGDVASLLSAASGRLVKIDGQDVRIDALVDVEIVRAEMSLRERLIQFVSSPEIAYLLLSGGLMAIFFEVVTPGGFVLGTLGGVMLLLGSIGLKMLPFSWAGVMLLGAGALLMALDLAVGTGGILALIGLPVFCLGGLFLFQAPGGELLRLSMTAVVGVGAALAICILLFAVLIVRGMRRKVATGGQGMIGLTVRAVTDVGEDGGQVRCHGELWRARAEGGGLHAGEGGVVAGLDGMTLIVRADAEARGDGR